MLKIEPSFKLPKEFMAPGKDLTLAQALRVYESRSHFGLVKVKTRGEVDRTTKKLYKQKGTGGARHGARSAPIFVGGGKAHGPRPLERKLKLSQAFKKSALRAALFAKSKENKVFIVSGVSTLKATREVAMVLKKIDAQARKFVVALSNSNMDKARFVKNIAGAEVLPFSNLSAFHVIRGGVLVLDKDAFTSTQPRQKKETEGIKSAPKKVEKKVVKKGTKK